MPTLSTEQLVRGLKAGRRVSPLSVDERIIDSYIEMVRRQKIELQTDTPEAISLMARTSDIFDDLCIPSARVALLQTCEVYVLPFPLCISYAERFDDCKRIVVGQGLVDLIASYLLAGHFHAILPAELRDYHLLNEDHDISGDMLIRNALFALLYQFFRSGESLPNFARVLTQDQTAQTGRAINLAIVFVLMHELGHHLKGHLNDDETRPEHFACHSDDLERCRQEEIEADRFVLDCLRPEYRTQGPSIALAALGFFSFLEVSTGHLLSEEHPLALARRIAIDHKAFVLSEFGEGSHTEGFAATKHLSSAGAERLLFAPRGECLRVLKVCNEVLAFYGSDMSSIWTEPPSSWLASDVIRPTSLGALRL